MLPLSSLTQDFPNDFIDGEKRRGDCKFRSVNSKSRKAIATQNRKGRLKEG
jgi:hypothetical protein